jgi:DNA polymerase-1
LVDADSRLHTSFNVTVAATGRLSSSNPNLQNIPIRSTLLVRVGNTLVKLGVAIRNAFITSPGCVLVSVDRGQDEMRWAAHGSQDSNMMAVFHKRQDIHWKTTCAIFDHDYDAVMKMKGTAEFERMKKEERAPCKNLGFGVLYGLTAPGLQRNILVESAGDIDWSEEKCQGFINQFFDVYPGLRSFMELQYSRARRYAMVWDAFGRVRLVPEGRSALKKIANEGMRKAGNHYEQSSSQGGVKLAMAEINVEMRERDKQSQCKPALQIHDQIVGDVDKRIAKEFGESMKVKMEGSVQLHVPSESTLEYAERWGELA